MVEVIGSSPIEPTGLVVKSSIELLTRYINDGENRSHLRFFLYLTRGIDYDHISGWKHETI